MSEDLTMRECLMRDIHNLEDQRDFAISETDRLEEERDKARNLAESAMLEADRLRGQLWRARDRAWKLARERNYWKCECLEQCQLLVMGADREERLARERDEAKADAKRATYDATQETLKVGAIKDAWIEACRERDEARKTAEAAAFESRRLRARGLEKLSNLKFQISNRREERLRSRIAALKSEISNLKSP